PTGGGGVRTSDGRLWFPTGLGLARVDPAKEPRGYAIEEPTPIAHITDVTIDGHSLAPAAAAKLKPGTGSIQFHYTGVYLGAPDRVQYSYLLEGLDRGWTNVGTRRLADYARLPPGAYRFLVRATLAGGGTSETQFPFVVLPHFFETKWFLCLCIFIAL